MRVTRVVITSGVNGSAPLAGLPLSRDEIRHGTAPVRRLS